ncbi:Crp/Fnr family transcriptional regulator [Crocinitomix catalasitica]|uniref:Crp/Fnr family transcriptional regulator n=1 Tax=Crocinitomix catalasitica TaxID=184607 RepID=UPI0004856E5B|nr:Crp/Fnr family transcriptional regulator [Crocinitomix catalasitica]
MNFIDVILEEINNGNLNAEELLLSRGDFLCQPNQVHTKVYFVLDGSIRIFYVDDQEEHTIRFGYKNSFFAALDSFLNDLPTNYYMQTIKSSKLLAVEKSEFLNFIQSNVKYQEAYQALQQDLILQQMEREIDLLTASPIIRHQRVLERSPQLFQEIPLKYIASYLRMTPETLSRIRKS